MQAAVTAIKAKRIRRERVPPARQITAKELARREAERERQAAEFGAAMKTKPVAKAVAKKIECQFPVTPEGRLAFAVVNKSIEDLFDSRQRVTASRFLHGGMGWASLAGVDPDWIRLQLLRAGISIDPIFEVRHAD